MLKFFGQMAKVNCLQILPAKHEVTPIDPKYYDRHAEMSKYRMPYTLCSVNDVTEGITKLPPMGDS